MREEWKGGNLVRKDRFVGVVGQGGVGGGRGTLFRGLTEY